MRFSRQTPALYNKTFLIMRNTRKSPPPSPPLSGEMGHHSDSSLGQSPAAFNPYLEGAMSYPGQYGLYPHHFSKLRPGPHDLNAYGDYPAKPQQAVPTYKWMQVKRNVPKPGRRNTSLFLNKSLARLI
jgi:hypothetical protein